ncbi:polycystic kidney disease protein 1-like 2 [Gigantopelta aegis]|uniref:polycystic kidney disease protein 1-like 2 n=1 Tax=Gigantopelta aegis TaxID=1735272 RepID=UPI001B88CBF9|nr:polycystic kidney disease protein 1-like 2 [Gigantopelta aegis]
MQYDHRYMYDTLIGHTNCSRWLLGLKGKSLMNSAWQDGRWLDFGLFEDTVPENATEEQVVFMDSELLFIWKYGPISTTNGCIVCQYKENDCDLSVLTGYWTIPRTAWKASGDILQNTNIDYVVLNLANGLNFFKTTEPKGYIQVDLQQDFLLYVFKCSSFDGDRLKAVNHSGNIILPYSFNIKYSLSEFVSFSKINDSSGKELKFSCGSSAMDIKSTHLPSLVVRFLRISWNFKALKVSFTLAMELFGCPTQTSASRQKNPQCGTHNSFYLPTSRKAYQCLYSRCPLAVETCGSFKYYYFPPGSDPVCSPDNPCSKLPCPDGQVCVNDKTNHSCHCPVKVEGSCDYVSNMYVMVEKSAVREFDVLTFYMVVTDASNADSQYSISITEDYTCSPAFTTIKSVSMGRHKCTTIQYYARTGGSHTAIGMHSFPGGVSFSNPVNFRIMYHNAITRKCLSHLQVDGTALKLQMAFPYYRWQPLNFIPSLPTKCNDLWVKPDDFRITEHKWSLSLYNFNDFERCYTEEDFTFLNITNLEREDLLVLPERQLDLGIFKVCLSVNSTLLGKTYKKRSCGYFQVVSSPLKIVLEPFASYKTIPNNQPIQLNASESFDPNSGTRSGIIFNWYCAIKDTNATCEFVKSVSEDDSIKQNYLNHSVETASVLNIEKSTLEVGQTYLLTLKITKPNVKGACRTVTIFSAPTNVPHLIIRCEINCKDIVIPSNRFKLTLDCTNCGSDVVLETQVWKLSSKKYGLISFSRWGSKSTSGNNRNTLELQEDALNVSTKYYFEVLGYTKNSVGRAVYEFETNTPPSGGSCFITPKSGSPMFTYFTVRCNGYLDAHLPLTYKISLKREDKEDYGLYYGELSTVNFLILPEGQQELDYRLNITVAIEDKLKTSTIVPLSVRVQSKDIFSPAFLYGITQTLVSMENETLQNGTEGFLLLAKSVVEMLGKTPKENLTDDDKQYKEKIHELIMNALSKTSLQKSQTLMEVTNFVARILSQEDRLSDSMEKYSLNMIKYLKDALSNISQNEPREAKDIARSQFSILDTMVGFLTNNYVSKGVVGNISSPAAAELRKQLKNVTEFLDPIFEVIADTLLNGFSSLLDPPQKIIMKQTALSVKWSDVNIEELFLTVNLEDLDDIGSTLIFPMASIFSNNSQTNTSVDVQMLFLLNNQLLWTSTAPHINLPVMKIVLKSHGGLYPLELRNLAKPADIFIAAKFSDVVKDEIYSVNASFNTANMFLKTSTTLKLLIESIQSKTHILKIVPAFKKLKLLVTWGSSDLDNSTKDIVVNSSEWPIPEQNVKTYRNHKQDPQLLFLPEDILGKKHTHFFVLIKAKPGQILDEDIRSETVDIKIHINSFTAECSYWNKQFDEWRQDGCKVAPFTSQIKLHCQCNHLTLFSGGIFIAPNTVDLFGDVSLFLTFFNNPVVIAVVVSVWLLFFLLVAWARNEDINDTRKIGVTVLADNHRTDHYVYLICVVTGWWAHAGTTSRVFIYLSGKRGQSNRHALYDRERHLFTSGAENWFLLKTRQCLGKIKSVVIWHDNSGNNPSWYLKEVVVTDIQTDETWHCVYDNWISVDKGPRAVYADIPAFDPQIVASKHLYQYVQKLSQDFRNSHIWISIFSKPPTSEFTRLQRLTCALCLLLSAMLTSIMFHGIPQDDPKDQIDYGDFHLSLVDFVVGIESALLVLPFNLIIIHMFCSIQPRHDYSSKPERVRSNDIESTHELLDSGKSSRSLRTDLEISFHQKKEKKRKCYQYRLPWYFLYVAYFLSITVSVICSYVIMLYGLKYGYHKSVSWLISFLTSFFQSAFVTEPLKVFVVALMFTLICKNSVKYSSGKINKALAEDEVYLQQDLLEMDGVVRSHSDEAPGVYVPPISPRLLKEIHKRVRLDQRTVDILQEIIMYFLFVAIVFLVVLGHSNVRKSYLVTKSIEDIFIHAYYADNDEPFYKLAMSGTEKGKGVTDPVSMWKYLNMTLLAHMVSGKHQSVANSAAYLVGRTRLRQIRLNRDEICISIVEVKSVHKCLTPFTFGAEDTRTYNENWENETAVNGSSMWSYQPGRQLDTLPTMGKLAIYPGGGYVVQLPRNVSLARERLDDIQQTAWIDEYTRAVFVEFTLFNPNVQLFTMVILMFEYSNTGFVMPYHQIYTANFYHYENEFETFVAACEIAFVLFLLCFTYVEIKKFYKQKWYRYFSDHWSVVELTILALGYTVIGICINRLVICNYLFDRFDKTDFERFISFNIAAFFDTLLRYIMSILILFTVVKFFKLLRFNARLSMLAQTLSFAKFKLVSYGFVFSGFIMAFSTFALLVFGYTYQGFRNFFSTILTLFTFMLGKHDYYGLQEANFVLGPIFFFLFSFSFQFMLTHYFIILLIDAFHVTKGRISSVKTEVHMVNFIMRRFRLLMVFDKKKKKAKLDKLYGEHDTMHNF